MAAKTHLECQRDLEELARLRELGKERTTQDTHMNSSNMEEDEEVMEKSSKRRKLDEPEAPKLFNDEGRVLRPRDGLLLWNFKYITHVKQEVHTKIANRLPFRQYSLVRDIPRLAQDDYYEDGTNEAQLVQESSRRVKPAWVNRGLVL